MRCNQKGEKIMKGSVRKRGAAWSYRFDMGIVDGKRQQKEKGGFRTKKEAEAALAEAMAAYSQSGQVFEPTEATVSDYLDQWFDLYCKIELKYNTQLAYRNIIDNHLKPAFGHYRLSSLTPAAAQEYANSLKLHGYSKSHLSGILSTFSEALDYAVEPLHYIKINPMKMVKTPKAEKPPRQRIILQPDDWQEIIDRFTGTRFEIPLLLGYYTGMRISEALGLTWENIDLDGGWITVDHQAQKRKHVGADLSEAVPAWYIETPKTDGSLRTIKIGQTLRDALRREKVRQAENELRYGGQYMLHFGHKEKDEKNQDIVRIIHAPKCLGSQLPQIKLVCVAADGQYTSPDSMKYANRVIHHELKIAFDYHSLRHTHATMLIEGGADIKDVQRRLGHADIATTLNTYVHDTEQMQEKTAMLFDQLAARKTS